MRPLPPVDAAAAVLPNPDDPSLTRDVAGIDHLGQPTTTSVVQERALTLYLNSQEIVTMMTIGDHPDLLAVGYLLNQNMLLPDDEIIAIDFDEDLSVVVVRTTRETDYEEKMKKRVRTSGCAQGTAFGDIMGAFSKANLARGTSLRTSWLYKLLADVNTMPSLYLKAGAIHGCVLADETQILTYMEDVGRHNAVDKIAGWMHLNRVDAAGKIFYTTGRLTSEMILKCVAMGISILVSRSGFTAYGVDLARQVGLTLVGRARGQRFVILSGEERVIFDAEVSAKKSERGKASS